MRSASSDFRQGRGWSIIRRVPLAIVFVVGTTVLAIASGALSGGTAASTINRFGYSLDHLESGRLYVLPTSDWLVVGTKHWASMMLLFGLFIVPLEALAGTKLVAGVFFIGSWVGTFVTSLAVLWFGTALEWQPDPDLVHRTDVGGSVGAWAAAGALNVIVGNRWPWVVWPVRIGSALYLGYELVAEHGTADVAHVLGVGIGTGIGIAVVRRHQGHSLI